MTIHDRSYVAGFPNATKFLLTFELEVPYNTDASEDAIDSLLEIVSIL